MSRFDEPVLASFDGEGSPMFRVNGGLQYLRGNRTPYFTITVTGSEFGGCCHDLVLKHFPQFADLVSLHLSDIDGVPMHAEANGWYSLAGYFVGSGERYHAGNSPRHISDEYRNPTPAECLQIWADHVRIDIDAARDAAERIRMIGRFGHRAFIAAQSERWKAEALACIAKHSLVVYGDKWNGHG